MASMKTARPHFDQTQGHARTTAGADRPAPAVPDRHGSLPGAHHWAREFAATRPHRPPHGACSSPLPHERQARQERRGRRRRHLRSRHPAQHALRAGQEERSKIILTLHRTRQGFVPSAPPRYNRMRGLLAEFGIVLRKESRACAARSGPPRTCRLRQHRDRRHAHPRRPARCTHRATTTASSAPGPARTRAQTPHAIARHRPDHRQRILASTGGAHDFNNGRQVAAWIGLVPGQYSSGGKARLAASPRPATLFRSLLVMGAERSSRAGRETGSLQSLGKESCRTTRLLESGRCHRRQECAAGLGGTPVRRRFSIGPRGGLNGCKKRL